MSILENISTAKEYSRLYSEISSDWKYWNPKWKKHKPNWTETKERGKME